MALIGGVRHNAAVAFVGWACLRLLSLRPPAAAAAAAAALHAEVKCAVFWRF